MFANAFRTTTRRIASSTATRNSSRAASASVAQTLFRGHGGESASEATTGFFPILAAATAGCLGYAVHEQKEEKAECISPTDSAAQAVKEKFATYWPRNIMIIFGPPVSGKIQCVLQCLQGFSYIVLNDRKLNNIFCLWQ
mmetsp:Transcript_22501/g.45106  ORF Transcript_22501/g.45106 Transcript_22501/m.45106 type:complete len:140 (-) Transcript_22501:760-1179(-)